MVISKLIVELNTAEKELYIEENGEKFYKLHITLDGCEIMAVISEFLIKEVNSRAALSGYLKSNVIREPRKHLFTYFYVTDMSIVESDTPLTNRVSLNGEITKIGALITRKSGRQVLPIILSRVTDDGNTSVLHAILSDTAARRLNSERDGSFNIDASGTIAAKHGAIEVSIDEYTLTERR